MKKRNFLAILMCLIMVFAAACGPVGDPGGSGGGTGGSGGGTGGSTYTGNELVLNVWNTKGGIGQEWLKQAKLRFEDLYKTTEFNSGKVGVEIRYDALYDPQLSDIPDSEYSVFFVANVDYNAFKNYLMPITDIVKNTSAYDNKTIESKLSTETKTAILAGGTDYYVLPHYQAYDGITYNKDMFDLYGFYLVDEDKIEDYAYKNTAFDNYGFVLPAFKNDLSVRTVGSDGVRGTYDDGLPSSIEEFKRLCKYIKAKNIAPFACWQAFNGSYEIRLTNAIWVNLEGYEGALAQYTFNSNGVESNIVTDWDSNGDPISTPTVITKENAWEVYQQESRYWALDFTEFVFKQSNGIMYSTYWNGGSNTDTQVNFLEGQAAMMIEGVYWMNEATDANTFNYYPYLKDVDVRYMPLPVQAKGSVKEGEGKSPVALDIGYAYSFINKNVVAKHGEEVAAIAKEFLQFCYSDDELAEFTKNSSVSRDLTYSIDSVYDELSEYAKSAFKVKELGNIVNPVSAEAEFIKNPTTFRMYDQYIWATTVTEGSTKLKSPHVAFNKPATDGWTVRKYFDEIKKDKDWWDKLSR